MWQGNEESCAYTEPQKCTGESSELLTEGWGVHTQDKSLSWSTVWLLRSGMKKTKINQQSKQLISWYQLLFIIKDHILE